VLCAAALAAAPAERARAQDEAAEEGDVEPYARVIVDSTALRSGPGAGFRRVHVGHRGDVFRVRSRATRGYWFEVELPDGTSAYILGDAVYVHEVSREEATGGRFLPRLFAPAPLPDAHGEIAVTFGILGDGGFMAIRPAFFLAPELGIELTGAAVVNRGGRILIGAIGGIVNIFPRSPVVPYVVVGSGFAASDPNADTFLLERGTVFAFYGGGGLRFCFRYRFTIRVEARAYAFIEPDRYVSDEEFSGGITVFF
jgi:hypothetical protein